ncbi:MAG: hypothetical protein ABL984_15455 [Pyrinomonadaceae bacterium]
MIFKQTIRNLCFLLSISFLMSIAAVTTFGQCGQMPKIAVVYAVSGSDTITVRFDYATDWKSEHKALVTEIEKKENWYVFSPSILAAARTNPARFPEATPEIVSAKTQGARAVHIKVRTALSTTDKYMASVSPGLTAIPAACHGDALGIKAAAKPDDKEPKDSKTVFSAADKRENSDIYVEGLAEGASGEDVAFTVDAAVGHRFRFYGNKRDYYWKPYFNIKASTSEDADPDALDFGVKFQNPTKLLPKNFLKIERLFFTESAKFEADRDFGNVNLIADVRMRIVSKLLTHKRFNIVPFVGLEVGRNLKSPLPEARHISIARPLAGARLFSLIYKRDKEDGGYQKAVTFETIYERRWPLTQEIVIADEDDDGNPIGGRVTRVPRDWIKSTLTYDFAKNFGFSLSYEYGSLPPTFKLVDHKFSLGLVFKGVFERKAP